MKLRKEFKNHQRITFNQCSTLGGHVYKGEKSSPILFWDVMEGKMRRSHEKQRKSAAQEGAKKEHTIRRLEIDNAKIDLAHAEADLKRTQELVEEKLKMHAKYQEWQEERKT